MKNRFLALVSLSVALGACGSPKVVPPVPHSSSSSSSVAVMTSSSSSPALTSSSSKAQAGKDVIVESPVVGSLVQSPLVLKAKARGNWFFEAQLPIQLQDSNGNVIATATAHAQGTWQTTDYVSFTVTIPFSTAAKSGFIVVKKDNPSGLPDNDAQVKIPVTF